MTFIFDLFWGRCFGFFLWPEGAFLGLGYSKIFRKAELVSFNTFPYILSFNFDRVIRSFWGAQMDFFYSIDLASGSIHFFL